MANEFIQKKEGEFQGAIEHFKKELGGLRAGRANPAMVENVMVDAYGSKMPLKQMASIAVQEARTMVVEPWDKNLLKEVEKALNYANLGLSISAESSLVRVTVPQMTEENRKDLVKLMSEKLEDAKIAVKQVREEVRDAITSAFQSSDITEDDKYAGFKELDEKVVKLNKELQELAEAKEREIMSV